MKNDDNLDLKNKAADGDADALFALAVSYRTALEALPDEIYDQEQNQILQDNRLLLANEFYKILREAAQKEAPEAREYIQELMHQDKVPLKRYDGKIFRGMAELAKAGDKDAYDVAVSISHGLKRALINSIKTLEFPGKLKEVPKQTARNFLNAKTDEDFNSINNNIQTSYGVFKNFTSTHSSDRRLCDYYNQQAKALNQISVGLGVYKHMIDTLKVIDNTMPELS